MAAQLKTLQYKDTGIPVIFEKHKSLPIFNLQLIFQNSGYINDQKTPGLNSLTAKLLNEGTKKDGSIKFARKLESKAISISATSGFETFVIEVNCLEEEYESALKYLSNLLSDPNFTQETLDKLKTLTLSKLKQKENDFDHVASSNLKKTIYKDTPLEYPSIGTESSINSVNLEQITNRVSEIFNINNLIIATGGSVKYNDIVSKLQPVLKELKKGNIEEVQRISFKANKKEFIESKETQQAYIYFASPFNIDVNSKDDYKAKVASFILGGSGFGSRLMEEIRVKNGLAYSAYGYITNKKSHSHFTGYLQTKLENTQKAKKLVKDIIKEFVANGVTQKELDAAKKFLSGSEPLRTETFSQRLNRSFMLYYKGLDFDYPTQELDKINNLTLKDLNKFIASHEEIKNLVFSIVNK